MQRYSARRPTGKYTTKYRTQRRKSRLTKQMKGMSAIKAGSTFIRTYNKFYPSLSPNLQLCVPAFGDTRFAFSTYSPSGLGANCTYFFYDPINLTRPINLAATDAGENLFSPQIRYLMGLYQEARLRMTRYQFDFSLDCISTNFVSGNSQNPPDRLDVAVGVVPLQYMRSSTGVSHSISQAGDQQIGVDYYSALTHMKGAQFFSLTTNGDKSNYKATVYVDGLSHTGNILSLTSSNSWDPSQRTPSTTITYPTVSNQNVVLLALRYKCHTDVNISNDFHVRMSLKVDSHYHFTDLVPQFPYANTTQIQ